MLFDSHCHLNFSAFAENYREIIADCLKRGIGVVNIGSQFDTSKRALEIANEFPNDPIYASIGLHPIHISGTEVDPAETLSYGAGEEPARNASQASACVAGGEIKFKGREEVFSEEKYQELIDKDNLVGTRRGAFSKKIVAIGEIGLDYWHTPTTNKQQTTNNWKERQKDGFVAQLNFAAKNNLPVIFHARGSKPARNDSQARLAMSGGENPNDAYLDMLEILESSVSSRRKSGSSVSPTTPASLRSATPPRAGGDERGVLHCFGSNKEIAQKFLDLGFYLGFTGIITFKNKSVAELQEVVKSTPLDKILVETDAPYLSPEPHRGEKNTPQNVEFVAREVAKLKNISYEEVCWQTTKNVKKIFNLEIRN